MLVLSIPIVLDCFSCKFSILKNSPLESAVCRKHMTLELSFKIEIVPLYPVRLFKD